MSGGPERRRHCVDLLGQLSEYLDGELSPARCRAIERHLEDCPCCGEVADSIRRAVALCREAGIRGCCLLGRPVKARQASSP